MSGGPDWCSWELCATEPARDRLRAWVDETPEPWQAMSEAEIRVALWGNFYGDELVRLIAAKVISQLPMPVADYTLKNVAFLAVGASVRGWAGAPPALYAGRRPWLVVLGAWAAADTTLPQLIAHELAHCWLIREPAEPLVDSFESYTLRETTVGDVKPEHRPAVLQWRQRYKRRERAPGRVGIPAPEAGVVVAVTEHRDADAGRGVLVPFDPRRRASKLTTPPADVAAGQLLRAAILAALNSFDDRLLRALNDDNTA